MPLLKILLRQRYSLSFFTTTLLMGLTTQPSLAFSITYSGSIEDRDIVQTYTLPNQSKGTTTLRPGFVQSLPRGGTPSLLALLNSNFRSWTFNPARNDLDGSFDIQIYDAIYDPTTTPEPATGAKLQLQYIPGSDIFDPTPARNNLHWIQRVISNHSRAGHGINQNSIDIAFGASNPFYDTTFGLQPFDERTFYDRSTREASEDHSWLAELYLVDLTEPQQVTIYNGIQWGWENKVEPVPEPLTMLGAAAALGYGAILKRKYSKNTES
jgi:hypothetical protein